MYYNIAILNEVNRWGFLRSYLILRFALLHFAGKRFEKRFEISGKGDTEDCDLTETFHDLHECKFIFSSTSIRLIKRRTGRKTSINLQGMDI